MTNDLHSIIPSRKVESNLLTARTHRREVWWQILLPLIFIVALLISGTVLLLSDNMESLENLAQIASMMLILPFLLLGVFFFLFLGILIYATTLLMDWLPPNTFWLQNQINRFNHRVMQGADLIAEPVLLIESWASAVKQIIRRVK